MSYLTIGTAGHIDHGKSTLVRALTGIDPDRLKEEKARGITIDLGFAHQRIGDLRLAFVDVPGHERFVRNMLAGATGIDAVMLVVAADESVMPQTREHFAICRLLDVRAGLVVLTKTDAADADLLELARSEVRDLVAGSFLDDAPIVPVSARTGDGLEALQQALAAIAPRVPPRAHEGPVRLPIDRAFTMKGFGAVVTGTLQSGVIRVDDDLELLPAGRRVRVRGLQVHGDKVRDAIGGQRVAVNLTDTEASAVVRGETLITPGTFETTRRMDITLELLPDARPLRHGTRVRIHHGTREVLGRIAVAEVASRPMAAAADERGSIDETTDATARSRAGHGQAAHRGAAAGGHDATTVPPGGRARARVRLESPLVVTRGDRFVVRAYSPVVTIGGGLVIDPLPARVALRTPAGLARLAALDPTAHAPDVDSSRGATGRHHARDGRITSETSDAARARTTPAETAAARVVLEERARDGLPVAALGTRLGLRGRAMIEMAERLVSSGAAIRIGDTLLSATVAHALAEALLEQVRQHHRAQPESEGLPREEARDRLGVTARVFDDVVDRLVEKGALGGRDRLALPSHRAAVPDVDTAALARLESVVREAGLKPPDGGEIAQLTGLAPAAAERLTQFLIRQKRLVKLGTLVFHQEALTRLKDETRALKSIDVASFKTRYDVSRKYAIPLLEYLDRERVTRRVGDERIVL